MKRLLWILALLPAVSGAQIKVNALPSGATPSSGDYMICDQSGTTNKCTFSQLVTYLQTSLTAIPLANLATQNAGTILSNNTGGTATPIANTSLPTTMTIPASQVVSNPALNTYFSLVQATGGSDVYPSNSTNILTTCNNNLCVGSGNGSKTGIGLIATFAQAYHYGDSITAGYETTGYNQSSYPYFLDQAILVPVHNRINNGVPGATSNSADSAVFGQPIIYNAQTLVTYMIGTNNLAANGAGSTALSTFLANQEAQAAWWLVPTASKILFNSGSVTYTGTWAADTAPLVGKSTSTNGATATFTGTGTTLYVVTYASNTNASTASLTCDTVATGAALNFTAIGGFQTQLTRVTGLSNTSHSCVLTVTAISGGTVDVEWAAFQSGTNTNTPTVLLGGTPPQQSNASATNLALYRTQTQSAVTTLSGDGYSNIHYVDTTSMTTTANYFNDTYHPDAYGQWLLAAPYVAEVNTVFGTSYTQPIFTPAAIVDDALAGGGTMIINGYQAPATTVTLTRVLGIGLGALSTVTSATDVTDVGVSSMGACLTCGYTAVFGNNSLTSATASQNTTSVGYGNLTKATGSYNFAGGSLAGGSSAGSSSSWQYGDFTGYSACPYNAGSNNTCMGAWTGSTLYTNGQNVTTDTNMTLLGEGATKSNASVISDATALGAGAEVALSHQIMFGASTVTDNAFNGGFTEVSNGRAVNTGTASDTIAANIASTYESANTGSGAFTLTFAAPIGDGERRRVCFHNLTGTITYTPTSPATAIIGPATIAANTCQEWVYNSASGTPTNAPATTWLPY
jgi:hypothetical protein